MAVVIEFPKQNVRLARAQGAPSKDQVDNSVETMKLVHVNDTLMALVPMIFERLYAAGFEYPEIAEYEYHVEFFIETLHSLMLKKYDIAHPFQAMSDNIFQKDEDGDLTLVDEISVRFNKPGEEPQAAANT
jgi:hypothetical protein